MAKIGEQSKKQAKGKHMENSFNQNSQNGKKKANRILYIALAAVVCVGAVVCAVVFGNNQPVPDVGGNVDDTPTGGIVENPTVVMPTFVAPAVGVVGKGHDLDTLVYSNTTKDWRVHRGMDIVTEVGAEVMASATGKITAIENDPLYGMTIEITHAGGAVTKYSNLSETLPEGITVGALVKCGQSIGCVGESARIEIAEEPHLHFEMMVDGKSVDPMDYISKDSAQASLNQDTSYEG
jgi:murein DD-endopeptidase MepM/ murein hydrolase activator NlpD